MSSSKPVVVPKKEPVKPTKPVKPVTKKSVNTDREVKPVNTGTEKRIPIHEILTIEDVKSFFEYRVKALKLPKFKEVSRGKLSKTMLSRADDALHYLQVIEGISPKEDINKNITEDNQGESTNKIK